MMLNSGMIAARPGEVLDLYFRQCSVLVTARDLAVMAATLANDGVNPVTGERLLGPDAVRDVLSVMMSCGMYNYAGQWAFEVGLPAKSGVSGGVMAVIPGQIGIGVFSPPLDAFGNSVRGVRGLPGACRAGSSCTCSATARAPARWSAARSAATPSAPTRLRTTGSGGARGGRGGRSLVLELQGALFFGTAERLIRAGGGAGGRAALPGRGLQAGPCRCDARGRRSLARALRRAGSGQDARSFSATSRAAGR